jgi:ribA/ribD-fused uncharacterized protein
MSDAIHCNVITAFQGEHRFLSNFYAAPVAFDGQTWRTSEHAFQAMKAADWEERSQVRLLVTPGEAKRYGQAIPLRPGWEAMKKRIMLEIVLAKFTQNDDLAEKLLSTGDAQLIEGNAWHDNYWGACNCVKCCLSGELGRNYLGRILEAVRLVLS